MINMSCCREGQTGDGMVWGDPRKHGRFCEYREEVRGLVTSERAHNEHPSSVLAELAKKSKPSKQQALMPKLSIHQDKVGYWLTPPEIMDKLQAEFNFDYDACPFPRPAGYDGIKEPWGSRTYCNPPFKGSKMDWARKAVAEHNKGNLVVLIFGTGNLSHICDVMPPEVEVRLIPPFYWLNPDGTAQKTPYSAFLFILRGKKHD